LLAASAGLGAAAFTGGLSSCARQTSISTDPKELVFWYWDRSMSRKLLGQAARNIPGTDKRLRADIIGGTFDRKLRTSLAGNAYIPDITAINSNVSLYFPNEDLFLDMNEFGAKESKDLYFDWKWQLGTTPTGRQCFWPMDSGPTGYYYRRDVFEKAGLPTEPDQVSAAIKTWDQFIEVGKQLNSKAKAFAVTHANVIFGQIVNASPERYFDKDGNRLYETDGNYIRQAWDVAVKVIDAGISGSQQNDTDRNAAWTSGKTAGHIEAVWWAEILKDTAPDTEGLWGLADQPVRPGNSGGSFLCLPHASKDPEAAFEFIRWITTPDHQAETYNEMQLFPSTYGAFEGDKLKIETGFFGDQDPVEFFLKSAESVPSSFISTYETQAAYFDSEITNVEAGGKDPEQAWQDAVEQTNRTLKKRGVEL
jgi:cellobiose transport system substrate-binding protein